MNRRHFSPLLPVLAAGGLFLGLAGCAYLPFHHKDRVPEEQPTFGGRKPSSQGLVLDMKFTPDPLKLAEARQINVTLTLRNVSKKVVTMKFPTSQIMEILLRDPNTGQIVSQWSSERAFTSDPRLVIIDPGERLEYNEPITTGELKAGKPYTLEAYLVGFDKELRATKAVLPQP